MLEFYLDDTLFDNPIGLDSLNDRLFYNEALSMYLSQLDGDIELVGDGYNYVRSKFSDNVCNKVSVRIYDTKTQTNYYGTIFINDVRFNLSKRIAECKIVSDKFIEYINNNKNIKVQLGVNLGKDQETITVDSAVTVSIPDPTSTVFVNRTAYRVFDVFDALVRFMSNEDLTFVSDYFDPSNPDNANRSDTPAFDVIMTGEELRLGGAGNPTPLISYEEFFSDMNRLHNLAGAIEGDTLRVEPKSYFRKTENGANISDVYEVNQSLSREQFYSSVKFGSSRVSDTFNYLNKFSFNGFQKEEFFLQGECNIDNELNLELRKLITDTNAIQDALPVTSSGSNNEAYDTEIVLIHCGQSNAPILTDSPFLGTFYFNEYYTNGNAANRWEGEYPFSIVQLLESDEPLVYAGLTSTQTDTTLPSSLYFAPDNDSNLPFFDNANYWRTGTIPITTFVSDYVSYFEAPSDMVIGIEVDCFITGAYYQSYISIRDSSGNSVGSGGGTIDINPDISFNQLYSFFNNYNVYASRTLYVPSGARVFVAFNALGGFTVNSGTIRINQLGTFGGVYNIVNTDQSLISNTEFSKDIDAESWKDIKSDPFKRINCTYVDGSFVGYPYDIKRNIVTGESDIKLIQRTIDIHG